MTKKNLIIGIVVLIALAGGVVLWGQKNKQQDTKQQTNKEVVKQTQGQATVQKQETTEKQQTNSQNQIIDGELKPEEKIDTSDWKTYRNEELGFEVKYPKGWIEKRQNNNNVVVTFNSPKNEQLLNRIKKGDIYGEGYMEDVYIYYYPGFNYFGNKEYNNLKDLILNNRDTKYLGQLCIKKRCNFYRAIEYGFGAYYTIFVNNDGHLYRIVFGNVDSGEKLTDIHKTIINSITFTK